MSDPTNACPDCGARVKPTDEVCPLCGFNLGDPVESVIEEGIDDAEEQQAGWGLPSGTPETVRTTGLPDGVFCNSCGWRNPSGARFCSSCGDRLQETATARPAVSPPRPVIMPRMDVPIDRTEVRSRMNRQVGIIVGAAFLLVIALFLITSVSRGRVKTASASGATADTSAVATHENLPLDPALQRAADSLLRVIDGLDGPQKNAARSDLVGLFISAGRLDRAAIEQQKIATDTDTPEAWKKTGDLYFDWMETIQGEHKIEVSRLSVAAYKKVLEKQPDNLGVKTDMAWASQYDSGSSMAAITLTNEVLQEDPNHLQANFNKGVFLIQINRLDQALTQFEKVKTIAGPGTAEALRAESAIEAVRDMQSRAGATNTL